jgi:hypothetical protein
MGSVTNRSPVALLAPRSASYGRTSTMDGIKLTCRANESGERQSSKNPSSIGLLSTLSSPSSKRADARTQLEILNIFEQLIILIGLSQPFHQSRHVVFILRFNGNQRPPAQVLIGKVVAA